MRAILFAVFVGLSIAPIHNSEWVPIPNDIVLRHFKVIPKIKTYDSGALETEATEKSDYVTKADAIKVVQPLLFLGPMSGKHFGVLPRPKEIQIRKGKSEKSAFLECSKAELLTESSSHDIVPTENEKIKNERHAERFSAFEAPLSDAGHITSYEVSEKPEPDVAHGYRYLQPPAQNELSTNEFINFLFKTLGKYNIRSNDYLPNYIKSQTPNTQMQASYAFLPIPARISDTFSNLKQLPVDPLLAVFLSNYGHYLATHFGPRLLLANKITTNDLTGQYKTYADTNSSNK